MELPNIIRLNNFYTRVRYMKEGNLSVNTIRNRINSGLIAITKIDGQEFIDIEKYPPSAKYNRSSEHKPTATALPDGIDKNTLIHISSYARKHGHTANKYYEAVLNGKNSGIIIGGEVFCYKKDIDAI